VGQNEAGKQIIESGYSPRHKQQLCANEFVVQLTFQQVVIDGVVEIVDAVVAAVVVVAAAADAAAEIQ
jgi:hypothetical protein